MVFKIIFRHNTMLPCVPNIFFRASLIVLFGAHSKTWPHSTVTQNINIIDVQGCLYPFLTALFITEKEILPVCRPYLATELFHSTGAASAILLLRDRDHSHSTAQRLIIEKSTDLQPRKPFLKLGSADWDGISWNRNSTL